MLPLGSSLWHSTIRLSQGEGDAAFNANFASGTYLDSVYVLTSLKSQVCMAKVFAGCPVLAPLGRVVN